MSRTRGTWPYTLWSDETDERTERKRAATDRPKRQRKPSGLGYHNLSEKQRRAEGDRIARELAHVEADFREVEEFEITYAPFEYRTRGSSLSPRTPPRKASPAPARISPQPSTSKAGLPEQPSGIRPQKQVMFRLADGSVVSSSDDEDVHPSRRSRQRIVSSSDDDAGDPPSTVKGRVANSSSGTDHRGVGESRRVAKLSNEWETSDTGLHSLLEGFSCESAGSNAESTTSSLTKADVIRKRRERIEKRQNLVERICSGHRRSSDDSGLKRSFLRTSVLTGSPPSKQNSGAANSSSRTDDHGVRESGRVAPEAFGALFHSLSKEDVNRGSTSSDVERASSSLTKADVIRKRRERIAKHQSVVEEISSSHRSSSDKSSLKRSLQQTFVATPKSGRFSGRDSHVRRMLWNRASRLTPSPKSGTDSEDSLAGLEEPHKSRPSFSLSSASSSFAGTPVSMPVKVWHSTPHGAPRRFISLGTGAAQPPPPRATLSMKAASDGCLQRAGRRRPREVLDRGETLVLVKLPERELAVPGSSLRGAHPPTNVPSAAPSPVSHAASSRSRLLLASGCRDESSTFQRSIDMADRSTLIRIGIGDNRERVLSSDALSASSAITSFCAHGRQSSRASQGAQQLQTDQAERSPAAHVDEQPVDLLEQLLSVCKQEAPVTFEAALRLTEDCEKCRKLGEGCTADVYLIRRKSDEESAVKVIPVGGEPNLNGELPMSLASIIAEAVMTRELSNLRFGEMNQTSGFIELKGMYCIQGTYHPVLVKSWNDYDDQWCSENCDPSSFKENQFYVLLEFQNGGKVLERFKGTIEEMESVFLQVACSLAVAEPELEFEHRDLHCDNVLVNRTEEERVEYVLNGRKVVVRTAGVRALVIDYTLSRLRKGGNVVYTDLSSDTALFGGIGSYQYDVYRIMKNENGDDWEAYHPHTNVLWLHYLLGKLLQKLPKTKKAAEVVDPSTSRGRLVAWADAILALPSAEEFVAQHVIPHLERDAEAPRKARRAERPPTREPHGRNLRERR